MLINPFQIKAIHHNAYATSNMPATVRYWRDLLGFKLVISFDSGLTSQYFFCINDSTFIAFFHWPDVKRKPNKRHGQPVDGPFIFDHTAFQVTDLDHLQSIQNKCLENSIPITDIIDHGFIYSVYSYDPNGIPLEFTVPQKQFDLMESPRLMASEKDFQQVNPDPTKWKNIDPAWFTDEPTIIIGEGYDLFKSNTSQQKNQ